MSLNFVELEIDSVLQKEIVTESKYLFQDGSLFFARVKSGQSGTWSLTE